MPSSTLRGGDSNYYPKNNHYNKIGSNDNENDNENVVPITIVIKLDEYPQEIGYRLQCKTNNEKNNGRRDEKTITYVNIEPSQQNQLKKYETIVETYYIDPTKSSKCSLLILETFGDGINCHNKEKYGCYSIYYGNTEKVLEQDNVFNNNNENEENEIRGKNLITYGCQPTLYYYGYYYDMLKFDVSSLPPLASNDNDDNSAQSTIEQQQHQQQKCSHLYTDQTTTEEPTQPPPPPHCIYFPWMNDCSSFQSNSGGNPSESTPVPTPYPWRYENNNKSSSSSGGSGGVIQSSNIAPFLVFGLPILFVIVLVCCFVRDKTAISSSSTVQSERLGAASTHSNNNNNNDNNTGGDNDDDNTSSVVIEGQSRSNRSNGNRSRKPRSSIARRLSIEKKLQVCKVIPYTFSSDDAATTDYNATGNDINEKQQEQQQNEERSNREERIIGQPNNSNDDGHNQEENTTPSSSSFSFSEEESNEQNKDGIIEEDLSHENDITNSDVLAYLEEGGLQQHQDQQQETSKSIDDNNDVILASSTINDRNPTMSNDSDSGYNNEDNNHLHSISSIRIVDNENGDGLASTTTSNSNQTQQQQTQQILVAPRLPPGQKTGFPFYDDNYGYYDNNNNNSKDKYGLVPLLCCDICLTEYEVGDEVTYSNNKECIHYFHKDCIVNWLVKVTGKNDGQPTCPCCRRNFLIRNNKISKMRNDDDDGNVYEC